MRKWRKTLAALLIATIAIGELSQTTYGSYGTVTAKAEEVSTVSGGAISEEQEVEKEVVTAEEETTTVEETAVSQKKTVMNKSTVSVASVSSDTLPSAVDNSAGENGKFFPEIGYQGQVGACLHWAMEYYIQTYSINRYFDRETKESNTFSPKWSMALGHRFASVLIDRCPLINFENDPQFLNNGASTYADCEADWMEAQKYHFKANSLWNNGMGIATPVNNGPDSESLLPIKEELANGNVLYVYTFYTWLEENQGKLDGKLCQGNKAYDGQKIDYACQGIGNQNAGGVHAMTIVGYNDNIGYDINGDGSLEKAEMGAFLVANQHGTWTGNNGFIWVSYDALNKISNVSDKTTPSGYVEVPKGKTRVTFGATIDKNEYDFETIAKEELDYYVAVTLRAKDRNINMAADGTNVKIEGTASTIWSSNLVKYNLAGGSEGEECEATMILACKDLSDGKSHYLYLDNAIGKKNAYPITIKNVKFVDNVHGMTYGATKGKEVVNDGETTKWYLNRNEVLPHFKKIKLTNTGTEIKVTAVSEDEAGDISYDFSYKSETGNDRGEGVTNKTGIFSFVPKTEGYYRVKVTATDKNGKSSEKTKLIKVDSTFKITDFDWDLNGTVCAAKTSRTLTASTLHGNGAVQYKFAVIDADGNHTIIQDYSTKAKANWKPNKEGTYILIVYAKDSSGTVVDSVKSVVINPEIKLESFTINKPSPQTIDTEIRATVKVTGGVGKKKCSIFAEYIRGSSYSETKVSNFNMYSDDSGAFKTHVDGTYRIYAVVKDEIGEMQIYNYGEYTMVKAHEIVISDFNWDIDLEETTVGKYRTLTGNVINNKGTVNYKYAVKDANGTITDICSYSTNSKVIWTPTKAGEYTLIMYAKDVNGTVVQKEKRITVNEKITLESITFDKASPQTIGTTISATAKVKGGTGNKKCRIHVQGGNYQYGSKDVYFTMSSNTTGTWTPDMDGTYNVLITMSDDSGYTTMVSGGNYVVNKVLSISDFDWDIDLEETTVGKYRTLTGAVINNSGTVNYKYALKDASGTITDICSYSTNSKVLWTPTKAGEYTLIMYAKDADGTVVQKEKKITVNEKITLESITFDKVSPQTIGTTISATAKVKGGTGNKKCRIHVQGGNYQYGSKDVYFTMSSNTTGSWTPDMDGTYNVLITISDDSGYTTMVSGGSYVVNKKMSISDFDWDIDLEETTVGKYRTLTGTVINNSGTVNYKYALKDASGTITDICSYSTNSKVSWQPTKAGEYTLIMYAKDADGTVVQEEKKIKVNERITLESITFDKVSPQKVGTRISATAEVKGGTGNKKCRIHVQGGNYQYGSKDVYFTMSSNTTGSWTPDVDGTYNVFITVTDDSGFTTMLSGGSYVVNKVEEKSTTIYYSGYSTPYIHYMIEGSTWTTVPGVKMEASSEKQGYTHKITIPLGEADKITACFNNGNGSWDSKNGANYSLGVGTYGIKNGVVTNLEGVTITTTPTVTPTVTPTNYISINYDNSKTNWSNVYAYVWAEGNSSVTPVIVKSVACVDNVYTFHVANTYKNILFKNTDGTNSWDKQTADATLPSTSGYTFVTDSGANKTGGHWTTSSVTAPPVTTAPPTNTPIPGNTVTFYYDNSKTNWSNVYVYAWGGQTTSAIKGTSLGNNVYAFTISSNYQNILFKNTAGTSSWDKQTSDVGAPQAGKVFTPSSASNKTSGTWKESTTFAATNVIYNCLDLTYVNNLAS